jgi:hypothetical protein
MRQLCGGRRHSREQWRGRLRLAGAGRRRSCKGCCAVGRHPWGGVGDGRWCLWCEPVVWVPDDSHTPLSALRESGSREQGDQDVIGQKREPSMCNLYPTSQEGVLGHGQWLAALQDRFWMGSVGRHGGWMWKGVWELR